MSTVATRPTDQTVKAAQRAMSRSIVISGVRCLLTYLVIPLGVPVLHFLGTVGRPISIVLCVGAIYFSISSMRRFWATNHRYRWHYTVVATVVMAYMTYGIVTDLAHIF